MRLCVPRNEEWIGIDRGPSLRRVKSVQRLIDEIKENIPQPQRYPSVSARMPSRGCVVYLHVFEFIDAIVGVDAFAFTHDFLARLFQVTLRRLDCGLRITFFIFEFNHIIGQFLYGVVEFIHLFCAV